jgi:hypothetical protein
MTGGFLVALGVDEVAGGQVEDCAVGEALVQVGVLVAAVFLGLVLGVDHRDGRAAARPHDVGSKYDLPSVVEVPADLILHATAVAKLLAQSRTYLQAVGRTRPDVVPTTYTPSELTEDAWSSPVFVWTDCSSLFSVCSCCFSVAIADACFNRACCCLLLRASGRLLPPA